MGEELNMDNILSADEISNLFEPDEVTTKKEETTEEESSENKESEKQEPITEVDPNELFVKPESVGNDEDKQGDGESTPSEGNGTSPTFYSSIAKALKEEGIFPDLDNEDDIKTPEDFRDLVNKQIQNGLTEAQKRIQDALDAGATPNEIMQYEDIMNQLNSITDDALEQENESGQNLRKQLIFKDLLNRGYSETRAKRELQKSIDAGTDIEDAKEALTSVKEFFENSYNDMVEEGKKAAAERKANIKKQTEQLKKSIMEDKGVFEELQVDKKTRARIYDNLFKPIYRDEDTGQYLTEIGKYEKDNRAEFLKNISLIFTLTNGFKDFSGLIKGKVKKEVGKGLRELEHTLNNTTRNSSGAISFLGGITSKDPESAIGKGWQLDI